MSSSPTAMSSPRGDHTTREEYPLKLSASASASTFNTDPVFGACGSAGVTPNSAAGSDTCLTAKRFSTTTATAAVTAATGGSAGYVMADDDSNDVGAFRVSYDDDDNVLVSLPAVCSASSRKSESLGTTSPLAMTPRHRAAGRGAEPDLSNTSANEGPLPRRLNSGKIEHGTQDTTSSYYHRATTRSTKDMLSEFTYAAAPSGDETRDTRPSGGGNAAPMSLMLFSPAMSQDIQSAPIDSLSQRCETVSRAAKSRCTDTPTKPSTWESTLAELRAQVLTRGGLSYELTHRSPLDPSQFIPSSSASVRGRDQQEGAADTSVAAYAETTPSSAQDHPVAQRLVSPTRQSIARSSVSMTTAEPSRGRSGSIHIPRTSCNNPVRMPSVDPRSSSGSSPAASYSALVSPPRSVLDNATPTPRASASPQTSQQTSIQRGTATPSMGAAAAKATYMIGGGSPLFPSGASFPATSTSHVTPRRAYPEREGSAVRSPAMGSMVIGYDFESRMRVSTPTRAPNDGCFFSQQGDRGTPGRRTLSPADTGRPRSRVI